MKTENFEYEQPQTIEQAFPDVDPGVVPLGGRVLVQLRHVAKTTKSGLILVEETRDTVKWNNQIARVIKLAPWRSATVRPARSGPRVPGSRKGTSCAFRVGTAIASRSP